MYLRKSTNFPILGYTAVKYRDAATQTDALHIEVEMSAYGEEKLNIYAVPMLDK